MAPVRTVQTTLTGCCEYTLDPFCASYRDFQHRAEDELAKFLYHALNNAWKRSQKFKCKNPDSRNEEDNNISIEEALQGPALDLRWQLGHLLFEHNRKEFLKVFKRSISNPKMPNQNQMRRLLKSIKDGANELAHKQYLQDDKREPARRHADARSRVVAESENILTLLNDMIKLVDMMTQLKCVKQTGSVSVSSISDFQ